jgi:hypothetical protein
MFEPRPIVVKTLILAVQAVDVREDVPVAKKAEETMSATRAAKRSSVTNQPTMLATHRATTIMVSVTLDLFGADLRPALPCDAYPCRKMGRL